MYNHEISIDITPDLAPMHGRRDTDVPAPKLSGGGEQLQIFSLTTINLESVSNTLLFGRPPRRNTVISYLSISLVCTYCM